MPGLHLREWAAEAFGTMLLVFGGLSAVCLDFGSRSPVASLVPSVSWRLLITGALFAGTGSLVAISPPGRLSGAHLNPAVTLAFWLTGHVHKHDLLGYVVSQCAGALAGAGLLRLAWGSTAAELRDGATVPASGISPVAATGIEALMTALLVLTIFVFVANRSTLHWTPLATWLMVTLLVWRGAPYTGTSLNPARSLGPAVISQYFRDYWVYVVGPLSGAMVAALLVRAAALEHTLLTAKLFHDATYPTVFKTML